MDKENTKKFKQEILKLMYDFRYNEKLTLQDMKAILSGLLWIDSEDFEKAKSEIIDNYLFPSEKNIENAAQKYANLNYNDELLCMSNFISGARWAISSLLIKKE